MLAKKTVPVGVDCLSVSVSVTVAVQVVASPTTTFQGMQLTDVEVPWLSAAIVIATGPWPTVTGAPAVLVAIVIGITVPSAPLFQLATYAVAPSGVIAIAVGVCPTVIGVPALPVASETGRTLPFPGKTFGL